MGRYGYPTDDITSRITEYWGSHFPFEDGQQQSTTSDASLLQGLWKDTLCCDQDHPTQATNFIHTTIHISADD